MLLVGHPVTIPLGWSDLSISVSKDRTKKQNKTKLENQQLTTIITGTVPEIGRVGVCQIAATV
jgi:hypothetical protein